MLLETKAREIKVGVIFEERQKYDANSPINPAMNKEVTMWLFVTSRIFFIRHLQPASAKTNNAKRGRSVRFIGRWFWLTQPVKPHPQLGDVGLLLQLCQCPTIDDDDETVIVVRWDDNSSRIGWMWWRRKRGQGNDIIVIQNNWWMKIIIVIKWLNWIIIIIII